MTDSFCHISGGWKSKIKGSSGLITSIGTDRELPCLSAGWGCGRRTLAFFALQIHHSCILLYLHTVPPSLIFPFFPHLIRSSSLDLGFTLIQYDLIFKKKLGMQRPCFQIRSHPEVSDTRELGRRKAVFSPLEPSSQNHH